MNMRSSVLWSWIAALSCLLCMGEVRCQCTEEGMEIEGGTYTLTQELEKGSLLVYHCPEDYYPYPTLSRVCQGSTWNPAPKKFPPQRCRVVECPDPTVLEQGSVLPLQEKYFVDNETTYECYSGYKLRGSERRVCLPNGKWSGSTPICSSEYAAAGDACADPGIPAGASRSGNIFETDDKVKYTCNNNNLILMGSSERVCQTNGQWTGIEPACYYKHTYDTTSEVGEAFGSGISHTLDLSQTPEEVLNIYIAVDISQSIDRAYVQNATDTISRLIQKVGAFPVTAKYEIFFFSSEVVEVVNIFSPSDGNETLRMLDLLANFQVDRENTYGTNLNLAFETIFERMVIMKNQVGDEAFRKHRHVLTLFTDGGYNLGGSPAPTVEKIKKLGNFTEDREEHLDIYIFGIGAEIFDGDLQPLTAGLGGRRYFRMKDMGDLPEKFDAAVDESYTKCGLHTEEKLYPWLASITILNRNRGAKRSCLGSLVSPRFVLTAAHCFTFDNLPTDVVVEFNNGRNRVEKVKKFTLHPEFNISAKVNQGVMEFYDYDVALVQLEEEVKFSSEIRPICIPCTQGTSDALGLVGDSTCKQQEQLVLDGRLGFVSKTGRNQVHGNSAYTLLDDMRDPCIIKALLAPGITTRDQTVAVTDNFLCTGGRIPIISHVACKGDMGGALFKNHLSRTVQVGVVSWGNMDLCKGSDKQVESTDDSRDFHINLFRVVPFLKSMLGNETQHYAPIKFL